MERRLHLVRRLSPLERELLYMDAYQKVDMEEGLCYV